MELKALDLRLTYILTAHTKVSWKEEIAEMVLRGAITERLENVARLTGISLENFFGMKTTFSGQM